MIISKYYKWLIIAFVIWPISDYLFTLLGYNASFLRYSILSISTLFIIRLYFVSKKNTDNLSGIFKLLLLFALYWLAFRSIASYGDLIKPDYNYIGLKQFLSGNFIVFFSFYLVNIKIPLQFLKTLLKVTYILSIIFIFIGVPMFSYFTSDIFNNAEYFVRNFSLPGMFLFLLFPYQKKSVNRVLFLNLFLALLMMMILARRNIVLFQVSAIFFLGLVIVLSSSSSIKKNKVIIILSFIFLSALSLIIFRQFDLSFFISKSSTGFSSRDRLILEFVSSFNSNPIDWYIGRGPSGSFPSHLGSEYDGQRTLIENGYLQIILKQGLLFLIPFVLLSFLSIYKGFFSSKNHLSKVCAILVIVNLIDMVGYGLPFLGIKYLNFLIAFSLCLSPVVRNMSDIEIKRIIKL